MRTIVIYNHAKIWEVPCNCCGEKAKNLKKLKTKNTDTYSPTI